MGILTNETFLVTIGSVVVGFFFSQTGIFTKIFDFIFTGKKEARDKAIADEKERIASERLRLEEIKAENLLLRTEVEKLRQEIFRLDKHLAENTIYTKTLLAWLEKAMPEGTNPFIVEMAKEIRTKNSISSDAK